MMLVLNVVMSLRVLMKWKIEMIRSMRYSLVSGCVARILDWESADLDPDLGGSTN